MSHEIAKFGVIAVSSLPQTQLEKLGVIGLYPKTGFSEENLKLYLQSPPLGERPVASILPCIVCHSMTVIIHTPLMEENRINHWPEPPENSQHHLI